MYTSKKYISALLSAATLFLAASLTSCIHNDIPYPRIQPNFQAFEILGASQATTIDTIGRNITVYLEENTDIFNVQVTNFALTPANSVWSDSTQWLNGVDLSENRDITVSLYQEYTWQVSAIQTITRDFSFEQQIGASSIEPEAHRVIAGINSRADISKVKVTGLKLAGSDAVMTPNIVDKTVDFTNPVTVTVSQWGRSVEWTIYVVPTDAEVTTESVDAWTNVAWLHGTAEAGKEHGFEYRKAGDSDWLTVPQEWITSTGGSFTARLIHLQANTAYEARAVSGNATGDIVAFTTGAMPAIPNGDFENWWLNGKIWCPWLQEGESWWDSGNRGATTLGDSNTTPSDDTPTGTGRAARLETRFVGIGPLGKLASGNIFSGLYVRTEGTNGVLSFGRPWVVRPTKLKGFFKYKTAPISSATTGFTDLKGRPDTCIVWCALIDSQEPFEVRTNPSNRHLFDPDGDEVVAYGKMEVGHNVDQYTPFEIVLNYKSTSRVPRYLIIVSSASKFGDYFTGGNGAVLYVDDFTFDWDY